MCSLLFPTLLYCESNCKNWLHKALTSLIVRMLLKDSDNGGDLCGDDDGKTSTIKRILNNFLHLKLTPLCFCACDFCVGVLTMHVCYCVCFNQCLYLHACGQ